jgi:hypothetical protein
MAKTYWESGGIDPTFLTLALYAGELYYIAISKLIIL